MSDFDSASDAAKLAHMTLSDHPHLKTPQAIADGPYGIDQINSHQIATGLGELAAMDPPRAEKRAGGWHLVRNSG